MQFKTFYWLSHYGVWACQYAIIYKYGKRTRQLKFKRELKISPQETMAASENRFAPELSENEVIELLEDLSNILGRF